MGPRTDVPNPCEAQTIWALLWAGTAVMDENTLNILGYTAVFAIGAIVGATELMSRYPDSPFRAVRNTFGLSYLLVNALGAIAALYLIEQFHWDFGLGSGQDMAIKVQLVQWMAAAFGAMSVLRSSLFNVRLGDKDLGVGPAAVLQVLLNAADRQVDRMRAEERSQAVKDAMKGIDSFAQIKIALPTHCMALMQNVSSDEEKRIRQVADNIEQLDIADCLKVLNLGLVLMNIVGDAVLSTAVKNVVESHHRAQREIKRRLALLEQNAQEVSENKAVNQQNAEAKINQADSEDNPSN